MRCDSGRFLQSLPDPGVLLSEPPPLTFARVGGRAVARLPRSRVGRWPSRLAHPVVRRLRRPPRGLSFLGAFRGLPIPVHRPSRCVVSGVLAGSVDFPRSPGFRLLSWNFSSFLSPLFRVSPGTSTPARPGSRVVSPLRGPLLRFGREVAASRLVPSSWFPPPRRLAPFLASSVFQLAPDLGFARLVPRRSLVLVRPCGRPSTSDRARDAPVRLTLRRFPPRRQPVRITASCSPPAVHHLAAALSRRGSASFRTDRGPWAARSAPSPSSPAFRPAPADGPEDLPLGCLRRLAPSGCPGARGRRQSVRVGSVRSAGPRGSARVERVDPHSGSPRGDGSPLESLRVGFWRWGSPAPSPPSRGTGGRSLRGAPIARRSARPPFSGRVPRGSRPRDGALGLRWLSGSRGVLWFPCRARRSLTVRDLRSAGVTGRLQGLAPPTSPVESGRVLQLPGSLFLPWVFFPSEALSQDRVSALAGTVGRPVSRLPSRPRFPGGPLPARWIAPSGGLRTLVRCRLFDPGGRYRRRSRPPWGSVRQRATVTTRGSWRPPEGLGSRRSFGREIGRAHV